MKKAPKVHNMTSNKGNHIPNQFVITTNEGTYFQSYQSIIAFISNSGKVTLDIERWNYSVTTSKYRSRFLHECTAETREKIKSGKYTLADLN